MYKLPPTSSKCIEALFLKKKKIKNLNFLLFLSKKRREEEREMVGQDMPR